MSETEVTRDPKVEHISVRGGGSGEAITYYSNSQFLEAEKYYENDDDWEKTIPGNMPQVESACAVFRWVAAVRYEERGSFTIFGKGRF